MEHMESALWVLTGLSILTVLTLSWLIRHSRTPKVLDFFIGVQLILFAAFFLGILGSIRDMIPEGERIKEGYDLAILIVPFFTAALGTNIISHVLLSDRNYAEAISSKEIAKRLGIGLLAAIGCVFPPVLLIYAIAVKIPNKAQHADGPPAAVL